MRKYNTFNEFKNERLIKDFFRNPRDFEFIYFLHDLRTAIISENEADIWAFNENGDSIFWCAFEEDDCLRAALINVCQSSEPFNPVVTLLKEYCNLYLVSDSETIKQISEVSDIRIEILGSHNWLFKIEGTKKDHSPEYPIELARNQDIEELIEMSISCYRDQYPNRFDKKPKEYFEEKVIEGIKNDNFWVIRGRDSILSFCELERIRDPDFLVIANLYTHPLNRNQSHCTELVKYVIHNDPSKDQGPRIAMKINVSNTACHSLAKKCGFVISSTATFCIVNPTIELQRQIKDFRF